MRNIILALIMALVGIVAPMKAFATVSNSTNQVIYNGDGVTTTFAFSFNVYNSASENDLLVSEETTSTGAVTNLTINTDYTVALTHATPSPGTITLTTAPASGVSVSILRQLPLTQLVQEADNSVTPASVRNNVYDRGVMTAQQLQQQLTRAILQNVFSTTSISLPAGVANYNLCWDTTGTVLANCAALAGSIAVPIANSNLQTLTSSNLVNGSSLFGTGAMTALTTSGNVGVGGVLTTSGNVGINSASPGQRLDIQGTVRVFAGNVGIGSASPGQQLDVQGTVRATVFSGRQLGAWTTFTCETSLHGNTLLAASDLFVSAIGNINQAAICITDSNASPTTIRNENGTSVAVPSCFMVVRKGDFYEAETTGGAATCFSISLSQ